ncbi:MAG: hypothetical protein V4614_01495 [Pseudomonadota bacterium]
MSAVPPDDLSGDGNPDQSVIDNANAALRDQKWRSTYRTVATLCAVLVMGLLGLLLYALICAVTNELSRVNNAVVAVVASLVIAITVLAIALLRATFQSAKTTDKESEFSLPNMEVIKALRDAFDLVIKGKTG